MRSLALPIFLSFVLSIANAISKFGIENSTCEEDNAVCQADTECNAVFVAMMEDCELVLNFTGEYQDPDFAFLYNDGRCPDSCQSSLDTYLEYLYPTEISVDYCECESEECAVNKQQLYDQRCIASDCANLWEDCYADVECKPYVDAFMYFCAPLGFWNDSLVWEQHYCPLGCAEALGAYVNKIQPDYTSLRFCDCNADPVCEQNKDTLVSLDCATPACEDMWVDCAKNAECEAIAIEYLDACGAVINGSWAQEGNNWCPDECKLNLQIYMNQVAPNSTSTDFCSCSDDGCFEGKSNLYEVGCIANDCTAHFAACLDDDDCNSIATQYLDACASVLDGSWTENWCPKDCKSTLIAYVEVALTNISNDNPLDYCDCNGHIACEEGRDRLMSASCFNVGCSKMHETKCTTDECISDWMQYITSCRSLVNGTWDDAWCPIDCQQNLFAYLEHVIEPNQDINDIESVCQCTESNGDCQTYFDELLAHGCVQETCQSIWYNCQNDDECKPLADEYLDACAEVIEGTYSGETCPSDCSDKLSVYIGKALSVDALLSDEFCDCQEEESCEGPLARFKELDCVKQNCEYQFAVCVADDECSSIATEYLDACTDVFAGTLTECNAECRVSLGRYVAKMYPEVDGSDTSDFCTCDSDNVECGVIQGYLDTAECFDPDDCEFRHFRCMNDDTCAPIAESYITACEAIIEDTFEGSGCPTDCAEKLAAYMDAVYGLDPDKNADEYCNCNEQATCITAVGNYVTLDCFGFMTTTTESAEETTEQDVGGGSANEITVYAVFVSIAAIKVFLM